VPDFQSYLSVFFKREFAFVAVFIAFGLLFSHLVSITSLVLFLVAMLVLLRFVGLLNPGILPI
jgi:hypothetical protein